MMRAMCGRNTLCICGFWVGIQIDARHVWSKYTHGNFLSTVMFMCICGLWVCIPMRCAPREVEIYSCQHYICSQCWGRLGGRPKVMRTAAPVLIARPLTCSVCNVSNHMYTVSGLVRMCKDQTYLEHRVALWVEPQRVEFGRLESARMLV